MKLRLLSLFILVIVSVSCKEDIKVAEEKHLWIPLEVTATAYNSFKYQTSENPNITAWGDSLIPGMKSIAVSRDLIAKGLKHGTMVRIDTFPDTFYINDKMNRKWRNRIDIYMGKDRQMALEWGRRKVCMEYAVLKESLDSITQNSLTTTTK
ncbi:3D domain-containing protein [Maribacter sp. HTCC2170]|uniref:3D domain-containing protein n=1 Tax=Maribacter sp. (strain HTCC2170 / KCCM 42371) TaxID=313603 RepID=UPI00006AFD16|nr:3D domain-containing protein [Maribacter sp. HTCC2170]EAR01323.1 hypothetical protein FB2170_11401 [Maribacter sp. HTCC2170]